MYGLEPHLMVIMTVLVLLMCVFAYIEEKVKGTKQRQLRGATRITKTNLN